MAGLRDLLDSVLPNTSAAYRAGSADVDSAAGNPAAQFGQGLRRAGMMGMGLVDDTFGEPYKKFIAPAGRATTNNVLPNAIAAAKTAFTGDNATPVPLTTPSLPSFRAAAPKDGYVSPPQTTPTTSVTATPDVPAQAVAPVTPVQPPAVAAPPVLDASTQSALSAAQSAAAGRVDPGATGGTGMTGFRDSATEDRNAGLAASRRQMLLEQGLNSPHKGVRDASAAGIAAGDTAGVANRNTAAQERIAGLRERGETTRANALNANNRYIHSQDNDVSLRGQDATLAGHRMANDVSRAQLQNTQFQQDRTYDLDKAKYGIDVAEKNRTAGEAAQKATQTHLENTFRTTDDKGNSVPDHGKIGAYNSAVDQTLPAFVDALTKAGTPQALAKAKEIQQRGNAALGPEDHAQLTQLFNTREQLRTSRSMLPGGAELKDSDNLMNFRQAPGAAGVQNNVLTPNRIRFVNGSSATPNDLQIPGGANAILPDINKIRNDNLTRGLRFPE